VEVNPPLDGVGAHGRDCTFRFMPKRLATSLGASAAVLILLGIALGSSGKVEGKTSTAQQISNVVFPLGILLVLATLVVLVVGAIRLSRKDRV
jgi:hypothetical protein